MPIDPSMAVSGPEWTIAVPDAPGAADGAQAPGQGGGFGQMLSSSISSLSATQNDAATASRALAAGQDIDPTSVVTAVERARLSMQMASTMRTKGVEAFQEIFRTQV